jgi:transposase
MVRCGQITDRAWEQIGSLLPREGGKRGGQWRNHRTVINGILWKLGTGSPWRPGRRPGFDREAYRRRNVVERCVGRLKQWRGVATRYEKRAVNYRAMVVIASLMVWLPA